MSFRVLLPPFSRVRLSEFAVAVTVSRSAKRTRKGRTVFDGRELKVASHALQPVPFDVPETNIAFGEACSQDRGVLRKRRTSDAAPSHQQDQPRRDDARLTHQQSRGKYTCIRWAMPWL